MKNYSHARHCAARPSVYVSPIIRIVITTLVLAAAITGARPKGEPGELFLRTQVGFAWLFLVPTHPTPRTIPYQEDFALLAHSSTAYPAGWQGWILGGGSTAAFRTTAPTDSVTLTANSTSATVSSGVHNFNGKLGFLPTGTVDPSLVLALNTTGQSSVNVAFDIMTIRNQKDATNTRVNQVDLQYRVCPVAPAECTGPFTSASGSANGIYQNNTINQTSPGTTNPQNLESKSYTLPSATDDQPHVQVRWVQRDSAGGGSRPSFAIDNLLVTGLPACSAPSVILAPADQNVAYGVPITFFTAEASGDPAPSVQWQVDSGAGYVNLSNGGNVSGADTTTLSIALPDVAMSGNAYRAVFSNGCDFAATSSAAVLHVVPKSITVTPDANQSKIYGDGDPAITYTHEPLLFADAFTGELAREPGHSAGSYSINRGTLALGPNYDLVFIPGIAFTIMPKQLAATVVVNDKVYDGTAGATAGCSLTGVIVPDPVSCSTGTAAFPSENVGTYSIVVSGISIGGVGSGNYSLPTMTATDDAEILVRPITISAVPSSKTYDGTSTSSGVPIVSGGSIAVGDLAVFSQVYIDRHAGISKVLTPWGTVDDGNSGENYAINFDESSAGIITPAPVTVTAVAATKVLDGNTSSSGVPIVLPSLIGGDVPGFIQTYDTPSAGTGKTLTPSGVAIDGNSGLNYAYTFVAVNAGIITASYCFEGFHSPIGGAVENGNGGTFDDPVRSFKLNSTIPIKFTLYEGACGGTPVTTGVHTLQMTKYANVVDPDPAIDATPTGAATTGNQFRLVDTEWHYNLDTKRTPGITPGTWLVKATLSDGSIRTVWISIKK